MLLRPQQATVNHSYRLKRRAPDVAGVDSLACRRNRTNRMIMGGFLSPGPDNLRFPFGLGLQEMLLHSITNVSIFAPSALIGFDEDGRGWPWAPVA